MENKGDFQHSALDGLGDLPEPLKRERGENRQTPGSSLPVVNVSPPAIPSGALPIYETLPANAVRFSLGQLAKVDLATAVQQQIFQFQVPSGRVMIVRQFKVNIEETYSAGSSPAAALGIPTVPIEITLLNNGNADIFNQGIVIQALDGYYPAALIGGPGDIITVNVSYDFSTLPTPPGRVILITHLTGDVLLPNELQTQYTALKQTPVLTDSIK